MDATEDRLKRFTAIENKTRHTYAAMLVALDEAVGRVLDRLKAEKLDQDTLVFFFSDNGGHPRANAARTIPNVPRKS